MREVKPTEQTDSKLDELRRGIESGLALDTVMRLYTDYMLARNGGNKVHASRALGVDRRTLQRWSKTGFRSPKQ